jgi:hypothetical protein
VIFLFFEILALAFGEDRPHPSTHLSGGELGDSLGSLRDSMLGKLSRKEKSDGGLDLSGGEGRLLVVAGQLGGLQGDALEDIVHEGVQDGDTSLGDTNVGVDLLEDLVDVRGVGLGSLGSLLASGDLLGGLGGFLSNSGGLGHF